jgi:amino acid permease
MDWSSVYDDNVEEKGRWEDKDAVQYDAKARTGILATFTTDQFTPSICYLFTVNYILGVGCLGVPYAFLESGLVLGTITICACSAASFVTVMWIAECGNRLFQRKIAEKGNAFQSPKLSRRIPDSLPPAVTEVQALLTRAASSMGDIASLVGGATAATTTEGVEQEDWKQSRRGGPSKQKEKRGKDDLQEPELTEICEAYLGRQYSVFVYQGSLMALAYIGLLAYSQVFTQGIISFLFPQADNDVSLAALILVLLLFSVVVVPLSLYDLNEQVSVQVAMSLLRFLSLGILLVACVYGLFADPSYTVPCEEEAATVTQTAPFQTPWFNTAGFGLAFTTSVFSQLFQHSVPGLVRPLAAEHRKLVPQIFGSALLTTGLIYVGLGCSAVLFFGNKTKESVNLNLSCYYFGAGENSKFFPVASFFSNVVLLFPALDTLSVYPLIANTLGGNLHASFPYLLDPLIKSLVTEQALTQDRAELKRLSLAGYRCLAAIPPILCSLFVTDLTVSLTLAGMAGIIVALVTPCLLRLAWAREETSPTQSSFSPWIFEDARLPYAGLAMAGTALIVCTCQLTIV